MKTLLTVPDLIAAIEPIVGHRVVAADVFRLIGSNVIKPFGFVQRMPIFQLAQVGEVAEKFRAVQVNLRSEDDCIQAATENRNSSGGSE